MGKKGAKRKTRWRTLSIGAPPSEEDEEEESSEHGFEANGKGGYRPRRQGNGNSGTSGYSNTGDSRSRRGECSGSPSQTKTIFNEDEYMKVVTPRQDLLFKKGYFARKKPWANNASNSATPSTTESQSASHSTADGSETTEYQQLLENGNGEYPPMPEPGTQVGYGTFYDHNTGYYYEYPVMLVEPNVLTAVPCGPVPLRPIKWVNPAFAPDFANQPYCVVDYQSGQNTTTEYVPVMDDQAEQQTAAVTSAENTNGTWNENESSSAGTTSCNGSLIAEENNAEQSQTVEENGVETSITEPFAKNVVLQQPMPVPHMIQPMAQQYMYPGHYMFGPSFVHVNGVTVQCAPMIRTTELSGGVVAFPRRPRKWKRKRQKNFATVNKTNGEEVEDCSSDCDYGLSSSRLSWSACPESVDVATTTSTIDKSLNPECQEFQLRLNSEDQLSSALTTSDEISISRSTPFNDQSQQESSDPPETDSPCSETLESSIDNEVKKEKDSSAEEARLESLKMEEVKVNGEKSEDIGVEVECLEHINKVFTMPKEMGNAKMEKREELSNEIPLETCVDVMENKTEGSNEDSGFESQTQTSLYPITEAVTDWLRRVNSPDIFRTANDDSSAEDDDDEEEKEESDDEPPKNLQGNPMPALSANSDANDLVSSRTASCGEFTRVNNMVSGQTENVTTGTREKRIMEKVTKKTSRRKHSERKSKRLPPADFLSERDDPSRSSNVGDVCEFTEEDSVAGMRVASSSRMDSKRVNTRRTRRRSERSVADISGNVDLKIRRQTDDNDEGIVEDTLSVKTFEKGEIVVSIDGKLLPLTSYEPFLRKTTSSDRTRVRNSSQSSVEDIRESERSADKKISNDLEDEEGCTGHGMLTSLDSIEEPDVLDCWETETIEPVVTPKKILQSHGIVYNGEAAEEDAVLQVNTVNLDRVEKYYRLARETSEIDGTTTDTRKGRTVPNTLDRMADSYCSEELPVFPDDQRSREKYDMDRIPVDEAFEVYESYYTGKTQFVPFDPEFLKSRPLYGQEGEGPIPCKAVCCNVQ